MTAFAPLGSTALGQASTNANYVMGAGSGTFSLSLRGAALLIADIFPHGLFELDGHPVTLSAQRPFSVSTGTFTLTGNDVELDYGFGVIANNATFTYTGHNVILDVGFGMVLDSGVFALTGQSIDFKKDMNISAETGTFTLTGNDAFKGVGEQFDRGQFTYTGHAVEMTVQRLFTPITAEFNYQFTEFKIRGWLTPNIPPAIWTDAA